MEVFDLGRPYVATKRDYEVEIYELRGSKFYISAASVHAEL
jgi:hypothetical protein